MPMLSFSSGSFSDIVTINRDDMNSWTIVGLTAGVTADRWSAELFADNLTDERAEVARDFVFDRQSVTYSRPRTIGVRLRLQVLSARRLPYYGQKDRRRSASMKR